MLKDTSHCVVCGKPTRDTIDFCVDCANDAMQKIIKEPVVARCGACGRVFFFVPARCPSCHSYRIFPPEVPDEKK